MKMSPRTCWVPDVQWCVHTARIADSRQEGLNRLEAPATLNASGSLALRLLSQARRPLLPSAWHPPRPLVPQLRTPPSLWPQATNLGKLRRAGLAGEHHVPAGWQTAKALRQRGLPSVQPPPRRVVPVATRCWWSGCAPLLLGSSAAADRPWAGPKSGPRRMCCTESGRRNLAALAAAV
jgi:hypothetical protein